MPVGLKHFVTFQVAAHHRRILVAYEAAYISRGGQRALVGPEFLEKKSLAFTDGGDFGGFFLQAILVFFEGLFTDAAFGIGILIKTMIQRAVREPAAVFFKFFLVIFETFVHGLEHGGRVGDRLFWRMRLKAGRSNVKGARACFACNGVTSVLAHCLTTIRQTGVADIYGRNPGVDRSVALFARA